MTLEEIRAGIIRLLRSGTDVENITGEDVTQAKRFPLLHVQLTPLNYGAAAAGMWRDKQILVDISYMEELHTSNKKYTPCWNGWTGSLARFSGSGIGRLPAAAKWQSQTTSGII